MLTLKKKPDQVHINNTNANIFITELIKCGVRHFCIGSGKRSIILANAIATNPLANFYTHFDERSLGFFALGIAKTQKEPVAVLVTSASALANLYPSIIEAKMSHHPLIVLAANRPLELMDRGCNQTIDQTKMFAHFIDHELNLNFSDPSLEKTFFKSSASRLYYLALKNDTALANASFKEPLVCSALQENKNLQDSTHCSYKNTKKTLTAEAEQEILYKINNASNPLILVGESYEKNALILDLSLKMQAATLLDILSNLRNQLSHPCHIPFYQQLIQSAKTKKLINPDLVLHFGKRAVSKELMDHLSPNDYIHIDPSNDRLDPKNIVTDRICMTPDEFCSQIIDKVNAREKNRNLKELQSHALQAKKLFYELVHDYKEADELYFFYTLMNHPIDEYNLFFANSMPIRYADTLFFACSQLGRVYANRGCSGIDGNIATALGIHSQAQTPSICILGDLSTLYDFNSFMIQHNNESPILFVVFNNQEGGIFHHLKTNLDQKQLEQFVSLKHDMNFKDLASAFKLKYFTQDTRDQLDRNLICALNSQSALLEIKVDAKTSAQRYVNLFNKIEKNLAKI